MVQFAVRVCVTCAEKRRVFEFVEVVTQLVAVFGSATNTDRLAYISRACVLSRCHCRFRCGMLCVCEFKLNHAQIMSMFYVAFGAFNSAVRDASLVDVFAIVVPAALASLRCCLLRCVP